MVIHKFKIREKCDELVMYQRFIINLGSIDKLVLRFEKLFSLMSSRKKRNQTI